MATNVAELQTATANLTVSDVKVTVHHLNNSRSLRICMLLEELKIPYEIKSYKRDDDYLAPASLKQVHPLGHSPIVEIQEGSKSFTLAESGAIVEYFVNTYGRQLAPKPEDHEAYAKYLYYLHFSEGTFMPIRLVYLITNEITRKAPWLAKSVARGIADAVRSTYVNPRMKDTLTFLDAELKAAGGQFFVENRFTAADIMLSYPLQATPTETFPKECTALKEYVKRLKTLPSYQAAAAKAGDLDFSSFEKS